MSVEASSWAWKQPVKGNAKLVLLALADHADREGVCWPGQKGIADKCGIAERTVRDVLGGLEVDGLVEREERTRTDGGQASNLYRLLMQTPPADSAAPPADSAAPPATSAGGPPADPAPAPRQIAVARVEPSLRTSQSEPSPEPAVTAEVFAVLTSLAARKKVASPGRDAVAKAIAEFPLPDHLAVAKDLEFWALHGNGQRRTRMAIANTYRNFLKRAEPRPASTSSQPRSAYDQPAN